MAFDGRARAFVDNFRNVPENATMSIDEAVEKAIPFGFTVVNYAPHAEAWWSKTLAITTVQESGEIRKFFLKVNHTNARKQNLIGEFESLKALHGLMPGFVPQPIAHGSYTSIPDVHFLLMDYVDLTGDMPKIDSLPSERLPFLHGEFEQANTWSSSWEKFFTDSYTPIFHWEQRMHGVDEEMQSLFKAMIEKVIPRLLRPLKTGGRDIIPTLLHGDLHDHNTGTDAATNAPLIFDATLFYGHNEYDLGSWNLPRNIISRPYIDKYLEHFHRSEQSEDFEDRLKLYHHRFEMSASGCFPGWLTFRELTLPDMRYLVGKYPKGYEGPHEGKAHNSCG